MARLILLFLLLISCASAALYTNSSAIQSSAPRLSTPRPTLTRTITTTIHSSTTVHSSGSSPGITASPQWFPASGSCSASCNINYPEWYWQGWQRQNYVTVITAATVAIIVNTRLNTTRTTTRFVQLPGNYTLPPLNEKGTQVRYKTINTLGMSTVVTLAYPTTWYDYQSVYRWQGTINSTLNGQAVCMTAPVTVNVTPRSHPPLPTDSAWETDSGDPRGLNYYSSGEQGLMTDTKVLPELEPFVRACPSGYPLPAQVLPTASFLFETTTEHEDSGPTPGAPTVSPTAQSPLPKPTANRPTPGGSSAGEASPKAPQIVHPPQSLQEGPKTTTVPAVPQILSQPSQTGPQLPNSAAQSLPQGPGTSPTGNAPPSRPSAVTHPDQPTPAVGETVPIFSLATSSPAKSQGTGTTIPAISPVVIPSSYQTTTQVISLGTGGINLGSVMINPMATATVITAVLSGSSVAFTYHSGASTVVLGSQTLAIGGSGLTVTKTDLVPPVTFPLQPTPPQTHVMSFGSQGLVLGGTTLGPTSGVAVGSFIQGSSTVTVSFTAGATAVTVGTQVLSIGGPVATVVQPQPTSNAPAQVISLGSQGLDLGSTTIYPPPSGIVGALTQGSSTITYMFSAGASTVVIGSQTLSIGGPAMSIVAPATAISAKPQVYTVGSQGLVVGTNIINLSSGAVGTGTVIQGSSAITYTYTGGASTVVIGTQTLSVGGQAITAAPAPSPQVISLGSGGLLLPTGAVHPTQGAITTGSVTLGSSVVTYTYTAGASSVIIGTQTLSVGGSAIAIGSLPTSTSSNVGDYIMAGLGESGSSSGAARTGATAQSTGSTQSQMNTASGQVGGGTRLTPTTTSTGTGTLSASPSTASATRMITSPHAMGFYCASVLGVAIGMLAL